MYATTLLCPTKLLVCFEGPFVPSRQRARARAGGARLASRPLCFHYFAHKNGKARKAKAGGGLLTKETSETKVLCGIRSRAKVVNLDGCCFCQISCLRSAQREEKRSQHERIPVIRHIFVPFQKMIQSLLLHT